MIPDSESQVRAVLEAYVASVTVPPSAIEELQKLKDHIGSVVAQIDDAAEAFGAVVDYVDARLASLQEQKSEK